MEKEKINTENRIVCFADVLGFKQMIDNHDSKDDLTKLNTIVIAFNEVIDEIKNRNLSIKKFDKLEYKMFSDNICISIPYNDTDFIVAFRILCIFVTNIQIKMLNRGVFIRGGISTGSYYSNENIIFSGGLVKSYLLESNIAIYPRIVVSKQILEVLYGKTHKYPKLLISDWNKDTFLNPFWMVAFLKESLKLTHPANENLDANTEKYFQTFIESFDPSNEDNKNKLKKIMNDNINLSQIDSIKTKYLWFLEFLNWYLKEDSNLKFEYV